MSRKYFIPILGLLAIFLLIFLSHASQKKNEIKNNQPKPSSETTSAAPLSGQLGKVIIGKDRSFLLLSLVRTKDKKSWLAANQETVVARVTITNTSPAAISYLVAADFILQDSTNHIYPSIEADGFTASQLNSNIFLSPKQSKDLTIYFAAAKGTSPLALVYHTSSNTLPAYTFIAYEKLPTPSPLRN